MKCTLLVIVFSACFAFASTANTRNPGNTDLTEVTLETNAKVNDQRISTEVDIR